MLGDSREIRARFRKIRRRFEADSRSRESGNAPPPPGWTGGKAQPRGKGRFEGNSRRFEGDSSEIRGRFEGDSREIRGRFRRDWREIGGRLEGYWRDIGGRLEGDLSEIRVRFEGGWTRLPREREREERTIDWRRKLA